MQTDEWRQIAGWLQAADIDCIEISKPGQVVRMLRGPGGYAVEDGACEIVSAAAAPAPGAIGRQTVAAIADRVGIFLAAHPMRSTPFVSCGDVVEQGDVIGLLQIGHVLAPVTAPVSGTVRRALVATASLVGYGTSLVEVQAGETRWR